VEQDREWELFKCHRCGKCCIQIGLQHDPRRICEIAGFLDLAVDQVIEKYCGQMRQDGKEWES
jgi:hypothetical protein